MKLSKSCTVISGIVSKKKKISDLEDFKNFTILILQTCFFTKNLCSDSNSSELDVICTTSIKRTFGKRKIEQHNNYNKTNANRINSLEVEETRRF